MNDRWRDLDGGLLAGSAGQHGLPGGIAFADVGGRRTEVTIMRRPGKMKNLPETLGPGCAFFDADGDGWPDILIVNGRDWKQRAPAIGGHPSLPALYLNNHDGTFRDATAGSGLDVQMYAMGVAVGDYNNDGRDDIYVTALDGVHLFHNEGGGRFRDVTREAGIHNASFGTSAAWHLWHTSRQQSTITSNQPE